MDPLLRHFLGLCVLCLVFIAATPRAATAAETPLYNKTILVGVPGTQSDSLKSGLDDLRITLQKITGESFDVTPLTPHKKAQPENPSSAKTPDAPAIVLATTDSALISDVMRKRFNGITSDRAVLMRSSESGDRLWIVAPTQSGLVQGIYLFLEELGCRWFVHGDKNWDILPQKKDIRVIADRLARDGCAIWPAIELEPKTFSQKLIPAGRFSDNKRKLGAGDLSSQVYLRGPVELALNARGTQPSITLKLRIERLALADDEDAVAKAPKVQLLAIDGRVVDQIMPRADYEWEDVTLKIPKAGAYRITIHGANLTGIQAPPRFAMALTSFRGQVLDAWRSRLYFFVPRGQTRVAMYSHSQQPVTIYDPQGNAIPLPRRDRMIIFDVPRDMDGRVWSMTDETSTRDLEMLNIPPYLSFFPEGMLIPDNVERRSER